MKVKIEKYGYENEKGYVIYRVSDTDFKYLNFLNNKLDDKTEFDKDTLLITIFYLEEFFPFRSHESKLKENDFIAREEIEMYFFLLGFLEDVN